MLQTIAHVNLAKGFRGGERQSVLLMRYLKLANPHLKQYLICRKGSEIPKYISDIADVTVIEVSNMLGGHGAVGKVDMVQAHEAKAVHWAGIHHMLYKTPFVLTRRVPQLVKNSWFNRYNYRHASAIVAISHSIQEQIIKSFAGSFDVAPKITLIYSVLAHMQADSTEVANLKEHYHNNFVFGHIGAYVDKHKGQRVLITAAKKFLTKYPNTRFILLGKGEDEEALKAESADTPQIEWLGFHKNVADYIEAMDVFVFPSRNEGLGSVLLDVMDHHVPIIASAVDGIPEVVTAKETGLLFPNGDADTLYTLMEQVYKDATLRKRLANTAYARLDKFKPEYLADCYTKLYNTILKS